MSKSIRIRTEPGVNKNINIKIDQDFNTLEILSLKLRQEDLYTQFCADYGVVVGRVVANGGFGVPNAHISIFVPIDSIDQNDPVISTLYPYRTPETKNEDGYRYNLLPYQDEYYGHTATGTFPTVNDVMTRKEVLQIYEKYYKYSVRTNESGDFMIVGVPLGSQKLVMDLDLSNMGEFSLRPSDLIRMGMGVPSQFNGQLFKSSENLDSLPQIVHDVRDIDVSSFWGASESCDVGITRSDFDLRELGVEIVPHATFMGSIFSSNDDDYIKASCRPKKDTGNLCDTTTGPGRILAIRQTILEDQSGDPILEEYNLENGGNVIDDNGIWLIDLPMNLEYITTNEFGERVVSYDPKIGVPTKSKYRFKVKWENESGLDNTIMRANYLIPNIKEHWTGNTSPSSANNASLGNLNFNKSYSFSLNWDDYADKDAAIKCEDTFYLFTYNKVYTTASHIDRFKWGWNRASHYGIKEITDRACMSENNRFPTNEGQRNFDFMFFIVSILLNIITFIIISNIPLIHVLALIYPVIRAIVNVIIWLLNVVIFGLCKGLKFISFGKYPKYECSKSTISPLSDNNPFQNISLPMLTYPDCEACSCSSESIPEGESDASQGLENQTKQINVSPLADTTSFDAYEEVSCDDSDDCIDDCTQDDDPTSDEVKNVKSYLRLLFSGYDGTNPHDEVDFGSGNQEIPGIWYKSPFALDYGTLVSGDQYRPPFDVSLPQSLNLMNQRWRYFDDTHPNRIRTKIINDQYGVLPSSLNSPLNNVFQDLPLIIVVDSSVDFEQGQLITFHDPDLIDDVNLTSITGFTDVNGDNFQNNQFNTLSITGNVEYNPSAYIPKSIKYIDPDGNEVTTILDLYNNISGGTDYRFKSGLEYFQIITGMTVGQARTLIDTQPYQDKSILWQYFLGKTTRFVCKKDTSTKVLTRIPMDYYTDGDDLKVYFLTRGVDPYTPKQKIQYDLSQIFGRVSYGDTQLQFEGDYYLNIPIQPLTFDGNYKSPAPHYNLPTNNVISTTTFYSNTNIDGSGSFIANKSLYHSPFLFNVDTNQFQDFDTDAPAHYVSLDSKWDDSLEDSGTTNGFTAKLNSFSVNSVTYKNINITKGIEGQKEVSGAGFQYTSQDGDGDLDGGSNPDELYTIAPSYFLGNTTPPITQITDSNRLIFRSDRLPTSNFRQTGLNHGIEWLQDFPLHLNDTFAIYSISDDGESKSFASSVTIEPSDNSGGLDDMGNDITPTLGGVLNTFSCEGMVALGCYSGNGENFGVEDPCELDIWDTFVSADKRVSGGCYRFVNPEYILSIPEDVYFLFEWKNRFKFMYGVCRGVLSHVFQNNWVNGTLYMPSFQKRTYFDGNNNVRRYKYCGDPNQTTLGLFFSDKEHRGPIYFNTDSNSFYYRSAPYYNGQFVPQKTGGLFLQDFPGRNESQLWQPTTIMDLGPKTEFLKEIMLSPEFEAYVINTLKSSTYQDISGILNLFIISRLTNSNLIETITGLGDASIQGLFSRQGGIGNPFFDSRVDGDYAQMISINSEYGVLPYIDGNYFDSITINGDRIGIWFSGDTVQRRILGSGVLTLSDDLNSSLTQDFSYVGSQEVPFYGWEVKGTTLFGNEENKWETDNIIVSKYQNEKFELSTDYPVPNTGYGLGYLYNRNNNYPELDEMAQTNPSHSGTFRVGSPFYFYFGLKRGKSAMNRYINKYIFFND